MVIPYQTKGVLVRTKGEGSRCDAQRPRWSLESRRRRVEHSDSVSNEEEPAPSASGLEIGNDNTASDAEQTSSAHKCRKTGLTKFDDEYTVSERR